MIIADQDIADMVTREGGFVDIAADKGGATKFGITADTLGRSRKLGRPATRDEVAALEVPEASAIYREMFIIAPRVDMIDDRPLALLLFDSAVQFGRGDVSKGWEAIEWMQEALGGLKVDGYLGPVTFAAYRAADKAALTLKIIGLRLAKRRRVIRRDASQMQFIAGWLGREAELLAKMGAANG